MPHAYPELPPGRPPAFRATVHGTVFGGRPELLDGIREGDTVRLVPDPPGQEPGEVWVHVASGDPVGHLPPEIGVWLCPWMREGGRAQARVARADGADVPSWRRLILEVTCGTQGPQATR